MTSENIKKERFDQLGLPPMELAESSAMNPNNNGTYKITFAILQKLIMLLALAVFGAGTYVLLIKLVENYDSPEIIVLMGKNETANVTIQKQNIDIFIQLKNMSVDHDNRKKREANAPTLEVRDIEDPVISFNDEELQRAREIILKHDVVCNDGDKQEICKNLVAKLNSLRQNRTPNESTKKINNEKKIINDIPPTEISKREVLPISNLDSIIESIPSMPIETRDVRPFTNIVHHQNPTSIDKNENCLLSRLMKHNYPNLKRSFDHTHEFMDLAPHLEHQLTQARFYSPAGHMPYLQTRDMDLQSRKPHPQDVDIMMSLLKPITELTGTENPSNISREAKCPIGTLPCTTTEECVDEKLWCDGNVDCSDVSDEARCSCKSRVDRARLCDGYFDCPFGEDEMGCHGCSDTMFSCEDLDINSRSTCFSKEQRCNNVIDCTNRKDEMECNMLAPSLLKKPLFAISNTEGFLHRNFKGDWYSVCKNPYMWAHDACRHETGLIIRPPFIQIVPIDPMLKVDYLNTGSSGLIETSNSCLNSSAVYVTCPDLLCGTRVQSSSQLLRENDAIENHLFGRNKRFLLTSHPYPLMFYGNRKKRNIDESSMKTNYEIKFDTPKKGFFDNMRNKRAESRVVGGKPSQPAAWPWMVAMYRDGMFHCGGVVITHSWVISAAHCVHKFWDHYYEIQVGMLRRFSFSPQEQSHKVTHVIVNQHYSQTDMKNDLSLLKVEPAIQFSRWVRPICLPSPDTAGPDWPREPSAGTICTAVGWGATTEHGPDPDHMREVEVPIWDNCKHKEDRAGKEICAGLREGGKDACQGDSGGPLLCRNPLNSQQWYMAGIVSHGDGCARKDEPGVYTRVSLFVKWIRYHISSHSLPIIQPIQECPGFKCESGISKCLPNKRKCDKIVDCLDGEDETNCNYKPAATFDENILMLPDTKIINEILNKKEALTHTVTPTNERIVDDKTSTTTESYSEYTTDVSSTNTETVTKPENFIEKERKNEDLIFFDTNESHEIEMTDLSHESPSFVSSNSRSAESLSLSNENITDDPSTKKNPEPEKSRGDSENISINLSREVLESRSSILANARETTQKNIEEIVEFTTSSTLFTHEETTDLSHAQSILEEINNTESTTPIGNTVNIKENGDSSMSLFNEDVTTHESNMDFTTNTESSTAMFRDDLIKPTTAFKTNVLDLLPNASNLLDNVTNSIETIQTINVPLNKSNDSPINELPNSNNNNDEINNIADIVTSEFQPAKLRRKFRVPKEFECRRISQRIPYHLRCDQKADCEDGTDELECTCTDYLSSFDEKLICDGVYDCADGQDESKCFACPEDKFLCKQSQVCLPKKHVCDGKAECPLGEDELDCFALSNGQVMEYDLDERPLVNLEGYVTKRLLDGWQVICHENLSFDQQEQAAMHICRYLGFSSANRYIVKYINMKEGELAGQKEDNLRNKRDTIEQVPIQFTYRQDNDGNDSVQHIVLKNPQVITEQCVPNITKTCKSLYVFCDNSLFTNFDDSDIIFKRSSEAFPNQMWPWIAKIFVDGNYRCTGVLVHLSWVLVSDSCLWDSTLGHHYITAVLGSHRTIDPINGIHELVYQIDAKKEFYRSKTTLLHLNQPAHYSNAVKPMSFSSVYSSLEQKSNCVAVGQDPKNNTISVLLEETSENCHPSNRCFVRKSKENICPTSGKSPHHWAGIISCHTDQGWYPAASFVDSRGECSLGDRINGTDIENLKNEIKYYTSKKRLQSLDTQLNNTCEGTRCSRGRCIPMKQVCDGVKHCEDGGDESEDACETKRTVCYNDLYHPGCECSAGEMKCRNGKCIPKELFRNNQDNCGDGTDEPAQTTCSDYLARVNPSRLCDGIMQCHDRSDEDPVFCKCFAKKSFKCGSKSGIEQCVALDMVCDGVRDCPNGEDEQSCIGLNAPEGAPYGTGQVIVRSHGVWHSKCYATPNHTKSELEKICSESGFVGGHAKQIMNIENFVMHPLNHLIKDSFNEIMLNNNTIIKIRNSHEPVAKAVFNDTLTNCFPVFVECL